MDANNSLRLLIFLLIYVVAIIYCLRKLPEATGALYANPILIAIAIYPVVTLMWSVDFGTTLRRSVAHALTVGLCIFYYIYFDPKKFLRMSSRIFLVGGIFSILYTIIFPGAAIHDCCGLEGSLKGIYGHKNDLGRISVIAVICAIYAPPSVKRPNLSRFSLLGVSILLLLGSQSTTNILTFLLVIGFSVFLKIVSTRKLSGGLRVTSILIVAAAIMFAATSGLGMILEFFGKDATFSGRTTLWAALHEILQQNYTYLGAGYGAFFTTQGAGLDLTSYIEYWFKVPTHAHNGYWDARVNLGIPGLVILFIGMAIYLNRNLTFLKRGNLALGAPAFCYLLLFSINNYTESETFQNGDYPWMLFLTFLLFLGKQFSLTHSKI